LVQLVGQKFANLELNYMALIEFKPTPNCCTLT